jgi:hypothetical protein
MSSPWLSPEHEHCWYQAVADDPDVRFRALNFWARRLNELPGPIMFTATKTELLQGKWQRLMKASLSCCACGERRWLMPKYEVPFYQSVDAVPITVGAGRQLALGAWGADTQQTQIQVSVQDGSILIHMLPYSTLSHAQLEALGVAVADQATTSIDNNGILHIRGVRLDGVPVARDSLARLAADIAEAGRPINRSVVIQIEGTNKGLVWVMYQATKVDLQADTMEVVVNATVQVMDRTKRAHPHMCVL